MARNTRNYPKSDDDSLKDTIKKLKDEIKDLKNENTKLMQENKTLKKAWKKTEEFLHDVTDEYTLEELIKNAGQPKKLAKERTKKIDDEPEKESERVRQKWAKWRKENL